jgi:hypothetical protein
MRRIRLNGLPVVPYAPGVDCCPRVSPIPLDYSFAPRDCWFAPRDCSLDVWIERWRSPVVLALCWRSPVVLAPGDRLDCAPEPLDVEPPPVLALEC